MTQRNDTTVTSGPQAFSRIIVAFPGAENSAGLINAATFLARTLQAELRGFYVREDAIRDIAGFSFAAISQRGNVKPLPITVEAMEQAWQHEEMRCRQALSRGALRGQVSCSFETVSGQFNTCLLETTQPGDLVALAGDRSLNITRPDLIDTVRHAIRVAGAVMVAGQSDTPRQEANRWDSKTARQDAPVLAIDDGDQAGVQTVALGARIAKAMGRPFAMLTIGEKDLAVDIESRARDIAADLAISVHHLSGWMTGGLRAALDRIAPALVVADVESSTISDEIVAHRLMLSRKAPLILLGRPINRAERLR